MSDALLERVPEFGKGKDVFAVVVVGATKPIQIANIKNEFHEYVDIRFDL